MKSTFEIQNTVEPREKWWSALLRDVYFGITWIVCYSIHLLNYSRVMICLLVLFCNEASCILWQNSLNEKVSVKRHWGLRGSRSWTAKCSLIRLQSVHALSSTLSTTLRASSAWCWTRIGTTWSSASLLVAIRPGPHRTMGNEGTASCRFIHRSSGDFINARVDPLPPPHPGNHD